VTFPSRSRLKEAVKRVPGLGGVAAAVYRRLTRLDRLALHARIMDANARRLALALVELERDRAQAGSAPRRVTAPGELRDLHTTSSVCTQAQFMTPEYVYWCGRLGERPVWHRKQWEYYFICQALWERGMLRPGRAGCGFGVGREPLPALFAALDCTVVATDAPASAAIEAHWRQTGQHATSLADLSAPGVAPDERVRANVTFRTVDMRRIPADLAGFDFVWSTCALEHLGSIERGIEFVERACRCLAPGGVAVHTTEFNVASDDATLDAGPIVLFRRRDLAEMERRVAAAGCRLAPLSLEPGHGLLDGLVALPPFEGGYADAPVLRLEVDRHVTTSLGLIVEKGERPR